MKKENKILLGLMLILVAAILILQDSRFYYLIPFIGGWSITELSIGGILIYWGMKNLIKKNFVSSSFFFSIFAILNKSKLNIENMGNWKLIFIGFLVGLGLSFIFGGKDIKFGVDINIGDEKKTKGLVRKEKIDKYSQEDNIIKMEKVFSSSVDYLKPMDLEGGEMQIVFSNVSIYLDQVRLVNDFAYLELSTAFSNVNLYVPQDWEVKSDFSFFGAKISDANYQEGIERNKKLKLSGGGAFSKIKIYYI